MSDKTTNETIAQIFFEKIKEEEEYEFYQCRHCFEGKGCIKRRKGSGWTNLANHAKSTHNDWKETVEASIVREGQGSMNKFVQRKVSGRAWNVYRWLEWVIMDDHPFTFVEKPLTRKNSSLEDITRVTLLKYMHALGIEVENKIKRMLPTTFGLIVDGWTCASEHYFAVFATWCRGTVVKEALLCCGVQDEDEESNLDFSAESLGDYLFDELELLGYDFKAIEFISGDNTACNPKLARLIGLKIGKPVPLIGCASHKLNLAVQHYIRNTCQQLVDNLTELCRLLRTLKNASKLRKLDLLCAILKNDTRWGSTFAMIDRYVHLSEHFGDCDFGEDVLRCIPNAIDHSKIVKLRQELEYFQSISMELQREGSDQLDMHDVRVLFDDLISKFPIVRHHLAADADIVHNKDFERAVVLVQGGQEQELKRAEKDQIRRFLIDEDDENSDENDTEEDRERNAAQKLLDENRERKRARFQKPTRYRCMNHIHPTTNKVERLFSRAKLVLTDMRKRMTPRHVELLLFLRMNRSLWSEVTVEQAMIEANK